MSPEAFWNMVPQEFWACYSLKYGTRKERSKSALNGADVAGMRQYLDEVVQKEREAGLRE